MIRLFSNANYDFIGFRTIAYGVTAVLLAVGLIGVIAFGVNYSVEFTGGTLVQFESKNPVDAGKVRSGLDAAGVKGAEVQAFGSEREYVIRAPTAVAGSDAETT